MADKADRGIQVLLPDIFKEIEDRARGRESFQLLRWFLQCVNRFSIRDSRVKRQAFSHHKFS